MTVEPILIGGMYVFEDEDTGERFEIPVRPALAEAIERMDLALARRTRNVRQHERVVAPDVLDSFPAGAPDRRLSFSWYVGSGMRWDGPTPRAEECPCCHGAALPENAYCLKCDRSGRDGALAAGAPGRALDAPPRAPRAAGAVLAPVAAG